MHPNFFHWHNRSDLKSDPTVLSLRWNAAAEFAKSPSKETVLSLVRIIVFPVKNDPLLQSLAKALISKDPTFPPQSNDQLVRVMAAAAVASNFQASTKAADAIALGIRATLFAARGEPICDDILELADQYLATEAETIRPDINVGDLEKLEVPFQSQQGALTKAIESGDQQQINTQFVALSKSVVTALRSSHRRLSEAIGRTLEESQFLWWLIGRRSSLLDINRGEVTRLEYAIPAAFEAAWRIGKLPPPNSVEPLILEALNQCKKIKNMEFSFLELLNSINLNWTRAIEWPQSISSLCPLLTVLSDKRDHEDVQSLEVACRREALPASFTLTAEDLSIQCFRELMFLKSLAAVA